MNEIWDFFAFPLNLLIASLWMLGLVWLRKIHSNSVVVRFLLSPAATISAICLLMLSCLWIGFSGDRSFAESLIFVIVLFYVQTVLFLITLRGWRRPDGLVRWRFLLLHVGLLLAIGSGFWGSPDSEEYRMKLKCSETSGYAYRIDGKKTVLHYEVELQSVAAELSDDDKPAFYEAVISIDEQDPVMLSVNHPHSVSFGEDIYLSSVSDDSCVLQIVREPWRYFALAGIIMMLVGAFMLFINGPRR